MERDMELIRNIMLEIEKSKRQVFYLIVTWKLTTVP